jgi:hypothetical protein
MKKVFTLLFVAMMSLCGWAEEVTFDFDNNYQQLFPTLPGVSSNDSHDGDFLNDTTTVLNGVSLTVSAAAEGNKTANRIWSGSPRLRVYSGTLTITAPAGQAITKMVFDQGKWNDNNTANEGSLSSAGWEGNTASVVITIAGNTQLRSIVVTVSDGSDNRTASSIEFAEGYEDRATCGKDEKISLPTAIVKAGDDVIAGAAVTWTLSSDSLAKISGNDIVIQNGVQGQVTVRADFEGDATYKPSTKSYTLTIYKGYLLLSSLVEDCTSSNPKWDNGGEYASYWFVSESLVPVNNTVTYANGRYIYLTDGTNNMLFYGTNKQNLAQGHVINGDLGEGKLGAFWGKLYRYNNLPEFSFTDMEVKIQDSVAVAPKTITVSQLADNVNAYIQINNAEFVSIDNKNLKFVVGSDSMAVYNQFGVNTDALEVGEIYTLTGMGSVYKETIQMNLIDFTTGANNISSMKADALKSDAIYNLQGQRVMATKKGLYIINGKKVVK